MSLNPSTLKPQRLEQEHLADIIVTNPVLIPYALGFRV